MTTTTRNWLMAAMVSLLVACGGGGGGDRAQGVEPGSATRRRPGGPSATDPVIPETSAPSPYVEAGGDCSRPLPTPSLNDRRPGDRRFPAD